LKAGAELVRITEQDEAEEFVEYKKRIKKERDDTPLIADIHFTPNAAEIAARIIEKVRVNPGIMSTRKNSSK
jgi:(E)-4-hydroxy-3-methylbut-2-enyl-diphosphate synthase